MLCCTSEQEFLLNTTVQFSRNTSVKKKMYDSDFYSYIEMQQVLGQNFVQLEFKLLRNESLVYSTDYKSVESLGGKTAR